MVVLYLVVIIACLNMCSALPMNIVKAEVKIKPWNESSMLCLEGDFPNQEYKEKIQNQFKNCNLSFDGREPMLPVSIESDNAAIKAVELLPVTILLYKRELSKFCGYKDRVVEIQGDCVTYQLSIKGNDDYMDISDCYGMFHNFYDRNGHDYNIELFSLSDPSAIFYISRKTFCKAVFLCILGVGIFEFLN